MLSHARNTNSSSSNCQLFKAGKELLCWNDPHEGQILWHQTDLSKVFLTTFEKAFRVFNFEEYVT